MAHNTELDAGAGGDTVVTVDLSLATYPTGTGKLGASCLYVSANATTAATPVTDANPFPIKPGTSVTFACTQSGTWNVTNAGTFAVQAAQSGAWTVTIGAGTANIGDVDVLTQPGAANIANNQVSVDTTSGGVTIVSSRATRRSVTITNHGTTDVYVGTGSVSSSNGFLLVGRKGSAVTIYTTAAVKGVVASGSQTVSYVEEYD